MIKKIIKKLRGDVYFQTVLKELENNQLHQNYNVLQHYKSPKVIQGNAIAKTYRNKSIATLSEVEFQVFSQFGDDGIIQWLIQHLPIQHKTFIEFGVENYAESNTRFLLVNNYWSGLVLDGSISNIDYIESDPVSFHFDIQAIQAFITAENINDFILQAKFKEEVGILSIDLDGNDYWVWKAIEVIKPIIVICEYNSLLGFSQPLTIPYRPNFVRAIDTPIGFWGASLQAFADLGTEKGYSFIGCNSAGNNAYFVKTEYVASLPYQLPSVKEGFVFGVFSEAKNSQGKIIRGLEKIFNIDQQVFFNTRTHKLEKFEATQTIMELENSVQLNRY